MKTTAQILHRTNACIVALVIFSASILAAPLPVLAQSPEPVVAVHMSELTQALETMPNGWWTSWHYFVMPESMKEALRADGTPFVEVSDADISAGRLLNTDGTPRYPILISLASEAAADDEIAPLRNYVAAGGFLFIGSSAFTRNPDGTTRGDFALASEMGLHMVHPNLQNWYENLHFSKVVNHRLVTHIPAGTIAWRMPHDSEQISEGVSPSHLLEGNHDVFQIAAAGGTTVIANGDSGPLLATRQYGTGNFIYHGAAQPLIGHGEVAPAMYAYLIYRRAIEWAFEAANLPIIKLSPWRYDYDAAFIVRHDFENKPTLIRSIESSASFEKAIGAKGDYYFCTGTLRQQMSDRNTVVAGIKRAVTNSGATIGSHNGGLKNPVVSLSISEFDYWHWGPDEALDITPPGYSSGKAYAQSSLFASFTDIESWLAGTDNGRTGCGSAGNCPRIWVSPYCNSTREDSYDVLETLGALSAGEQKISPFPHWTLSYKTSGKRYSHISQPVGDWYIGTEIPGALEWGYTTASMRAAVDFYYNLGTLINFYGHEVSSNTTLRGQYARYCAAKPRIWAANAVGISDWWKARSNAVVTPAYSIVGDTASAQVAITGASDSGTTIEVAIPNVNNQGIGNLLQVLINDAPASPADYRTVGNTIKVRVGASASSAIVQYTINSVTNPVPAISSLNPSSQTAGGPAFTLTVNGTNFAADSVVQWNGSNRTTTYVSSTQLTAAISAADIATAGTALVTVFNPTQSGGTSVARIFLINNPVPATTSLSPASAAAGGAAFTLTVNGTGFVSSSVVQWKGSNRTTTYVSSTQLRAAISVSDIATAGTATATVFTPTPGGGTSNAQTFTINVANNPVPTTTSLSPASAAAGGAAFTLTVNGTGFVSSSVVQWKGSSRTTTYVSSTQLTAAITAADIATAGTATVTVFTPTPGGGTSNAQTFTINAANNPVPTTTSISPTSATAGGASFTLTVNGTGFINGSTVQWKGSSRTTTYVSSTQLTAAILASDITTIGTATVTVITPAPGGGTSNAQTFTINVANNPVPTTTSLSPASAAAGGAAFTLTVNGTGFVSSSVVQWKGSSRTTTYVSSTQLTAAITAADIATAGTATVTVFTPTPGGGTSNAQTFTINTAGTALFSDDFTRPAGGTISPWVASMGTWTVSGGVMKGTGSANQYSYASFTPTTQWTDYTVQGRIQIPAGSLGGGIGGRVNATTGAHYGAWVYPAGSAAGSNFLILWKFLGWQDLGNGPTDGVPMQQVSLPDVGTGWHTLRMTFTGSRIQVYYDGALKIDMTDNNYYSRAAYLSGGITVDWYTWSPPYTITVDDISVTAP